MLRQERTYLVLVARFLRGCTPERVDMWAMTGSHGRVTRAGGATSHSSLSCLLAGWPKVPAPGGVTGQLTNGALVTAPADVAVHRVHPPPLVGTPATQVIEPFAASIGALTFVIVVVVVTVMT